MVYGKRCRIKRRIASRSPICDAINIRRVAVKNVREKKGCRIRFFSHVFHRDATDICWRMGGDSTLNSVSFSYRLFFCVINAEILAHEIVVASRESVLENIVYRVNTHFHI